mgnify:CR=1 FL=1
MRRPQAPRLLYLRSLLPSTITYLLFLSTLGVYLLLTHGTFPGPTSRMAWQANEGIQIYTPPPVVSANETQGGELETDLGLEDDGDGLDGALPLDVWDPLLPHKTGCAYQGPFCKRRSA